jgi:hypothetical protein
MKKPSKSKDEQVRISQGLPIIIKGKDIDDKAYLEKTIAEDVTRRGVFFATKQHLVPGSSLRIYSVKDPTKTIAKVEVVWLRNEPKGVGTKLIGSNTSWMKFLLENSIALLEEISEKSDDENQNT